MTAQYWLSISVGVLAAFLTWYVLQPKITRIEWENGQIDYWQGRMDPEELKKTGHWPAVNSQVKSRTVHVMPRPGESPP